MSTLLCIYYPQQLLAAFTAIHYYRRLHKKPINLPIQCYVKPFINGEVCEANIEYIKSVTSKIPNVELYVEFNQTPRIFRNFPVKYRAKHIKEKFKNYNFNEIFYAHDIGSDFTVQVFMQAFPNAKRICYGDSLGLVYSRSYFESLMYNNADLKVFTLARFKNYLARIRRKILFPKTLNILDAEKAILVLPTDLGGNFLKKCTLEIPSRNNTFDVIETLKNANTRFSEYIKKVITEKKPEYLFILSNLTESGFTTRENEVELYAEIIQRYIKPNSTVFIKQHPGSTRDLTLALENRLKSKYQLVFFDPQHSVVPVELADVLIESTNVISISYSSISIKYLYQKKVIHGLNTELIQKYIFSHKVYFLEQTNNFYLKVIDSLESWDGNSIVC